MANQQADAKVTVLNGKAYAERNGTRITLTEGADIYASDTIITDSGSGVEVVFRDNAVIKLGPGSQVAVQDFVYDGESNPSFAVQLVTGVMTSLSGEVVKQNPAAFKISTPRATIGIRGTETYHSVQGDMETHAVVHISQGHIVMLNSSDGQAITLGSAMQAVSLSESGKPLTIRTFQPNEMDKLQNALSGMGKKAPVQDAQPDQDGPQTPNTGDEGAQSSNAPQPAATSTVVQDEIRVLVVAEAGTEAVVAVVQGAMQAVQDTTGIIVESPVISPIGTDISTFTPPTLTETLVADNPATPPADFVPPPAGEVPAPDPTPPAETWENITVPVLFNDTLNGSDGNDSITVEVMTNATISAGAGNDIIDIALAGGNNTINGGAGSDTLYLDTGSAGGARAAVTITGIETVYGTGSNVILGSAGESVTLHGVSTVTGSSGNDTITIADTTFLTSVAGGAGDDSITIGNGSDFSVQGGDGNDTITLGAISSVTIDGGAGDDSITITQSQGANTVNGGAGNDVITIEGGTGATLAVTGDAGADTITVNNFSGGVLSVDGGAGNDVINITGTPFSGTVYGGGGSDIITIDVLKVTAGTTVDGEGPGVSSPNSDTGTGTDHIIIKHIAAGDAGAVATIKGGHGDDVFTLGSWDNGTSIRLDLSNGPGNVDRLEFDHGATEAVGGGVAVTGGYAVDFVQDGKTLTVIFEGIDNQYDYNALKSQISGLS